MNHHQSSYCPHPCVAPSLSSVANNSFLRGVSGPMRWDGGGGPPIHETSFCFLPGARLAHFCQPLLQLGMLTWWNPSQCIVSKSNRCHRTLSSISPALCFLETMEARWGHKILHLLLALLTLRKKIPTTKGTWGLSPQVFSLAIVWILVPLIQYENKHPERKCPKDCLSPSINFTVVAEVLFLLLFFILNKVTKMLIWKHLGPLFLSIAIFAKAKHGICNYIKDSLPYRILCLKMSLRNSMT